MSGEWRFEAGGWVRELSGDGGAVRGWRPGNFTTHESFQIREWAEQGMSARQIGEKLGRKPRAVERHARRKWGLLFINRYRPEEPDILRDALRRNQTVEEIAAHWQRTPGAIRAFAERHGISLRRPRKINRISIRIKGDLLDRLVKAAGSDSGIVLGRFVRATLREKVAAIGS